MTKTRTFMLEIIPSFELSSSGDSLFSWSPLFYLPGFSISDVAWHGMNVACLPSKRARTMHLPLLRNFVEIRLIKYPAFNCSFLIRPCSQDAEERRWVGFSI
jgi:hypothetical protein